jgi:hypothetical protein
VAANTISTKVYRDKYRLATLDTLLRKALVAEKICQVDRSGLKTLQNPYGSQPTATVQAIVGTYQVGAYVMTDDTLTVSQEVIIAEQVFDFEMTLTRFDLFANRVDEQSFAVAYAIDKYVLNELAKNAGDTYTTPSGSFATAANFPIIVANLLSRVAGYSEMYNGCYLVVENTDLVGVIQQEVLSGFHFADSALNNGFMTNYMGVEIYVVRTGTFQTYSAGSNSFQNQGKRLFGIKNMTTYASPQGIHFEEKGVSGKTGKEVVTYGYIGAKVWAAKAALTIAIVGLNAPSASPSQSPSASLSPSSSVSSSPSPS